MVSDEGIRGAIEVVRGSMRNDGAEGESAHLVCAELERRMDAAAKIRELTPEKRMKMRRCAPLLGKPGDEVVIELLDALDAADQATREAQLGMEQALGACEECVAIMHADPRRHFKGCPHREALPEVTLEHGTWEETARQESRNVDFYRGLVDDVATYLGTSVYVQDDGGLSTEPLRVKVPELVGQLRADHDRYRTDADGMRAALANAFGDRALPSGDPVECIRAFAEGFAEYEKRTLAAETQVAMQMEELRRLSGIEEHAAKLVHPVAKCGDAGCDKCAVTRFAQCREHGYRHGPDARDVVWREGISLAEVLGESYDRDGEREAVELRAACQRENYHPDEVRQLVEAYVGRVLAANPARKLVPVGGAAP